MTKRILTTLAAIATTLPMMAQGWPAEYGGVMLQGFYWDSFTDSQWTRLEQKASDFEGHFDLVWIPQSGKCLEDYSVMGYTPYYYFNQNSSFGTEDELRSMIGTWKEHGIGAVADVVVNHHNTSGWFSFPEETYNGETYQLLPTDICADDDSGATKTQADTDGVTLSSNNDEGEDWSGMRDLDHKSENVQTVVKAYVKYLVDDLGYTGFRYDMAKGFDGSHVADYNDAAGVEYSVGEYWDGNASNVKTWIKSASMKSAAFDFPFRYTVRDAINNSDWTKLASSSLMSDTDYRQYAVTFVENHDTEYRSATESQDPIKADTLAANAFLLAMPGTPCVFYKHYQAYPKEIKAMIDARKIAGITNTTTYSNMRSATAYYSNLIKGDHNLIVVVGSNPDGYTPSESSYTKILSGYHYRYYLANDAETPFADVPSGTYSDTFDATLTAVSATSGAQLVYTLDGSTPSASNGTVVESGATVTISASCTLTVGLLVSGTVTATITRNYTISEFEAYGIKVYVNADEVGWTTMYYYTWGGDGTHASSSWPGDLVTTTEEVDGKTWYVKEYTINSESDCVNFVFAASSSVQTVDLENVTSTGFYEISSEKSGTKYLINKVTTGITSTETEAPAAADGAWYTLQGVRIAQPNSRGIYIHNGRKVIIEK